MVKKVIKSALINLGLTQMILQPNHIQAQDSCCEPPCANLAVIPGDVIQDGCVASGYLLPATISPECSWDFYASGEFIYFGYSQEVTAPAAQKYTFVGNEDFHVERITDNLLYSSPYRPGFRLSVGVDLDSVVLDVTYMRYHSTVNKTFNAGNNAGLAISTAAGSLLTANEFNGLPALFDTIRASRRIEVDRILVSLQRPIYMGSRMIMDLNFGLLTYFSEQKWRFVATALPAPLPVNVITSDGFNQARHKSWAIGPNLGFKAIALMPWHLQGLFRVDLCLQYGDVTSGRNVSSFPDTPLPINNTTIVRTKAGYCQAVQSAEIGLGWGSYLCCDKYHLNLSVTYNFISQYLLASGIPYSATAVDLYYFSYSLHGIAVGARMDF